MVMLGDAETVGTLYRSLYPEDTSHGESLAREYAGDFVSLKNQVIVLRSTLRDFDTEEKQIVPISGGRFRISGLTLIHDVEETLEIEINSEEVSTFGGLITRELGHIPKRGERLSCHSMDIIVYEVDDRRVIAALVRVIGSRA